MSLNRPGTQTEIIAFYIRTLTEHFNGSLMPMLTQKLEKESPEDWSRLACLHIAWTCFLRFAKSIIADDLNYWCVVEDILHKKMVF
jgi:hypothetical protein